MTEGGKLFIMKSTLQIIAHRKTSSLSKMVAVADKGSYLELKEI
tara:strand:- start:208 stop:339 length:132 start_codon:yes stop_codon:yes gene_type:complete